MKVVYLFLFFFLDPTEIFKLITNLILNHIVIRTFNSLKASIWHLGNVKKTHTSMF